MKEKKKFNLNKLMLYVYSNSFYLFLSITLGLRNLKNMQNFDFI